MGSEREVVAICMRHFWKSEINIEKHFCKSEFCRKEWPIGNNIVTISLFLTRLLACMAIDYTKSNFADSLFYTKSRPVATRGKYSALASTLEKRTKTPEIALEKRICHIGEDD